MAEPPTAQPKTLPPQSQERQPGHQEEMVPRPEAEARAYRAAAKLEDRVALVSGGDSGIGRAVAIAFAKEGAKVAVLYLEETEDAAETCRRIEAAGGTAIGIAGDVGDEAFCREAVRWTVERFGRLDILVNNAAEQHLRERLEDLPAEQLERTFRTNLFSMFHLTRAALPPPPARGPDHQHHFGHRLPGQPAPGGLCRQQGGHRGFHPAPWRCSWRNGAST